MRQKNAPFFAGYAAAALVLLLACVMPALFSCEKKGPQQKTGTVIEDQGQSRFLLLKKRLQEKPGDAGAWYDMADLYYENNLFGKAARAYGRAARLKPDGYTYLKMGMSYDACNKPRKAVAAYRKAVRYMPSYAVAYNNLGAAYGRTGDRRGELAALKKAIKLRPHYATAIYNLGYAYLRSGDRKAAMKQYEALVKFNQGLADDLMKKMKSGIKSAGGESGA